MYSSETFVLQLNLHFVQSFASTFLWLTFLPLSETLWNFRFHLSGFARLLGLKQFWRVIWLSARVYTWRITWLFSDCTFVHHCYHLGYCVWFLLYHLQQTLSRRLNVINHLNIIIIFNSPYCKIYQVFFW